MEKCFLVMRIQSLSNLNIWWGILVGLGRNRRKSSTNLMEQYLLRPIVYLRQRKIPIDRLFTVGIAGIAGAKHINNRDFKEIIEKAKSLPEVPATCGKSIITGFHHKAILGIADKIVPLVKSGKIKRFFLIGGCDGAKPGRNYYTEFAERVPKDCVIITLACGKYRFNKMDFGDIEGIPRLIDMGQCNNAYSAVQVALALSKAFNCSVNELPLTFVLSWFEQKAVAILLSLLYLNIKGM